jgi:2'-5' RNA ligase
MPDKALYLLAVFDGEAQEILAGYYRILQENGFVGSQTKGVPYHFTLGSCGVEREKELVEKLGEVCAETDAFGVDLAHIGLFGLNVLFIAPAMNAGLLGLREAFFPNVDSGEPPWVAHATLLIDTPEATLRALPLVAGSFKPFKARIESVALYEFFPARMVGECGLKRG